MPNHPPPATRHQLTIGWLYPDLMSTYGDRGNIICLQKRCEWRGIATKIINIDPSTSEHGLSTIDLLFGGGAQDREQTLVMRDLRGSKKKAIIELIEHNIPSLFVCGAPQLMGEYYEPAKGDRIEGLGIFAMHSKHPGPAADRLIGNTVAEVSWNNLGEPDHPQTHIVGFENHGGRTYLNRSAKPFATVVKGYGNNGEDRTEGIVHKNAIGCYFHGPLLPKNPVIADWLIKKALEVKYQTKIELAVLDDKVENRAQAAIVSRLGVSV